MRGLDATIIAESEKSFNAPIALVKLEFDSGDVRMHTWLGDITYNGDVYAGAGGLSFIGPIDEDTDLTRNSMKLSVRGIPNDIVSIALNEHYQGRPVTIYVGYLNTETMQLIGTPAVFKAQMDNMEYTAGQTATITINIEDEFAVFEKPKVRRYTNADQQSRYPGDKFFEYVEQATAKDIQWGR